MANSIHAEPPPPIVTEPTGNNYATGSALGKGGFAICHRAERYERNRPTGHMVALKIVKSMMEPAKLAQKFVTELQIHSKVSHRNIVTFYRAFSFQTNTYVVLELCSNGSLADMLKKRKCLTLPEIRRIVIQICGAVKYLHQRHIVHRDLKTGNLFLDGNMDVKVGDFGLAALLVTEKEMEVKRRTTMCGTPNYLAPEILEKGKGHDERVDLWSIGVIAYTLAVGKAPFHASSKEEIYKKLKQGDYKWPELSSTANDISADLRETVASLLVPEEMRPSPDHIVSQNFFRIAYVPPRIPSSARERAPHWPDVTIPSAEVLQRGWSDSWYEICEQSGVGFKSETKCFKLNGGDRVRSIVHEMALEAQLGTVPKMPIPADTVYTSNLSDWNHPRHVEGNTRVAAGTTGHVRTLREISNNEVAMARPVASDPRVTKDADLMPPPPQPAARVARSASIRKAARTISEETAKATETVKIVSDPVTAPVLRVSKTRSAPSAVSTLKELSNSSGSYQSAQSHVSPEAEAAKSQATGTTKRSADASLARRPRATVKKSSRPVSPKLGPLATLDELKRVSPLKRTKRKGVEADLVEILSDHESDDKAPAAALSLPPPPQMAKSLPRPRRHMSTTQPDAQPGTDPSTVLQRLTVLRDNLAAALSGSEKSHRYTSKAIDSDAENLPFVSRWVDYSRKHGVGYVLEDGTVGCIINASTKYNTPVTHVIVRNGQKWLGRVGKAFENIDRVPFEIFEDRGDEGIVRKVYKGLGSVKEGPLAIEAERRRTLSVLWVKFGRYMCQSLDGEERASDARSEQFVRFYQRLGNVGIWAFSNGCLQIHFPDHTKIVLSADGTLISATCITPEAAEYLFANADLLPHHVSGREALAGTIQNLLHESGRTRSRIVNANRLTEKLDFVLEIVEQWIENEGLGRVDEDDGGVKLSWDGPTVKDGSRKVDRVTVGRLGGDAVVCRET